MNEGSCAILSALARERAWSDSTRWRTPSWSPWSQAPTMVDATKLWELH